MATEKPAARVSFEEVMVMGAKLWPGVVTGHHHTM
jgi:hypothetical protein